MASMSHKNPFLKTDRNYNKAPVNTKLTGAFYLISSSNAHL